MSIVVEDFHKVYDQNLAVAGISFTVAPGEILGLVGQNGAGKTTTLRTLAGILRPTRGRLSIDGHDLTRQPVVAKSLLAYVPDDPHLFESLTVWEHLRFVASVYRVSDWQRKAEALLTQFELLERRDSLASALSRGMRQKVAISCGLLHDPKAILLDEPLTGLDPSGIRTIQSTIRRRAEGGASVIVSSHLLALVEDLCTSVMVLHRGRILASGTLAGIRRELDESGRQESLEALFFRITERADKSATESQQASRR